MVGPIDVFGVAGQSNAQGRGTAARAPVTVAGLAFEHRGPGALVTPALDPCLGALSGSAWPAFLDTFTAASGRPACIVSAASGGAALVEATPAPYGSWSPQGTLREAAAARYGTALTELAAAGWKPVWRGVVWHQGEQDAQLHPDAGELAAAYTEALRKLGAWFSDAVAPGEVHVLRLGDRAGYRDGYAAVRAGQEAACLGDGFTLAYTECDQFPARGWMRDPLHYAQIGLNHMGTHAARAVATHLGFLAEGAPPPHAGPTIAQRLRKAL
ncbi:MAG TPA: sialate O-acetylesterase [Nocardioides sp.]|nr:sialate O-acetylesterase [Nocardioides sp.]